MRTYFNILNEESKKRKCKECGKNLSFFEGYRHPTLGANCLVCSECFEKIEQSVECWGRFVLWNSFNPNSPDPTFLDSYPFPHENDKIQYKKIKHH